MDEIVEALRDEQDRVAAMVEPLDRNGLATPSRCEGWTVADVLLHLAQTNELAVASVMGTFREAVERGPRVDDASSGLVLRGGQAFRYVEHDCDRRYVPLPCKRQ